VDNWKNITISRYSVRKKSFGGTFIFSNCHIIGFDTGSLVFLVSAINLTQPNLHVRLFQIGLLHIGLLHIRLLHIGLLHISLLHIRLLQIRLLHIGLLHIGFLHIGFLHIGLLHIGFLHKGPEKGKISGF
jgi:hypothetical protein